MASNAIRITDSCHSPTVYATPRVVDGAPMIRSTSAVRGVRRRKAERMTVDPNGVRSEGDAFTVRSNHLRGKTFRKNPRGFIANSVRPFRSAFLRSLRRLAAMVRLM